MQRLITRLITSQDDRIRQNIAKEIIDYGDEGIDVLLDSLKSGRTIRVVLLTLYRVISKEKLKTYLISKWKRLNFRPLLDYSKDSDPKVRKSAYLLMGEIKDKIIENALIEALEVEETLFLFPTIILALGNIGSNSTSDIIIKKVDGLINDNKDQDKHIREIIKARDKAIDKLITYDTKHKFKIIDKPLPILLTTMDNYSRVLYDEAKQLYFDTKIVGNCVEVKTADLEGLYRIRTFYEALISPPRLRDLQLDTATIAQNLSQYLSYEFLCNIHNGDGKFRYRIELRGDMLDKDKIIDSLIRDISVSYKGQLINSTSNYELEFRIEVENNKCNCMLKLYTIEDNRFDYRLNAIPASIKGENAAICMGLVSNYLKGGSRVLDPFMGTGTMLVERAFVNKDVKLDGVEIYRITSAKARDNFAKAKLEVNMYSSNILDYNSTHKYDEIISNMPYGNRVGTHKDNERLYNDFMAKIPQLLHKNGVLILLTADYRLLKEAAKNNNLKQINEYVINNGGLYPHLLVYKQ